MVADDKPQQRSMTLRDGLVLLRQELGDRFLLYVLNLDAGQLASYVDGSQALPKVLHPPIANLVVLVVQALGQGQDKDRRLFGYEIEPLARFIPEDGTTWAVMTRQALGGDSAAMGSEDPLERALLVLARDAYPAFLVNEPTTDFGPDPFWPHFNFFRHPAADAAHALILADPVLTSLVPNDDPGLGRSGYLTSSTGRGSSIQSATLAEGLCRKGWEVASLEHSAPTLSQFSEGVRTSLKNLRDAAHGRAIPAPVRCGVAGVLLPEGEELVLPWGRLRSATEDDLRSISHVRPHQVQSAAVDGDPVVIDYRGDIVLETAIPCRVEVSDGAGLGEWPKHLRSFDALYDRLRHLQLALLLTEPPQDSGGPRVVSSWQVVHDPVLGSSGSSWREPTRMPHLTPYRLSPSQCERWAGWVRLLDKHMHFSIEVAVTRTIRASIEREDPSDSLLDAMIALENLFGARQGEVTLRVSASIAWLLGDGPADRQNLRTRAKRAYDVRSAVAHGQVVGADKLRSAARDALELAVACLQALFERRSDLIPLKSEKRSELLLLGSGVTEAPAPTTD